MKYIILDIETTGRSSSSKMIEFSALKFEDEIMIDEYTTFINPETKIPRDVALKTGITDEMVISAPTINEVIGKIVGFIRDQILIGYNIAGFSLPYIRRIAEEYDIFFDAEVTDLLPVARRATPELPDHKLSTVAAYYGINVSERHRSKADCIVIFEVYKNIKNYIYEDDLPGNKVTKKPKTVRPRITYDETEDSVIKTTDIFGANFVLTGEFDSGTKDDIALKISKAGGVVKTGVSSKTKYLVVGGMGSSNWKYGNLGGKIKKAKELQESGVDIHIISEKELIDLL